MIPYESLLQANHKLFDEYQTYFRDFLQSGWYILGRQVVTFEEAFAAYCDSGYCTGVANGLDALVIALKAADLPPGSEVIVPSNTYIATILSVIHAGYVPVLAEPELSSYNISAASIEPVLTKKTAAVIAVHLYGKCCAMDEIITLAEQHRLIVIEDVAQAHGARYKGKIAGSFGHASAFSFYPTKNLGALGDAGAIVTSDEVSASLHKTWRNYGSSKKYINEIAGYNSRIDELQAGLLSIKLKYLDELIEHKRKIAAMYSQNLKDDFIKPVVHDDHFDVYHIFAVRHPRRDELKQYLADHSIGSEIHYPVPPHQQKALEGRFNGRYPISEQIHSTILSLPASIAHSYNDIERVIEVMNRF